ncbi:MAG TPA: aryl-sulfate sulfotransferase [Steroidobacteraceae bacterium]
MARFSHLAAIAALASGAAWSSPTVYPTGTTIYYPARTWSGFTVISALGTPAVLVIDMNGNLVKRWDDYDNSAGGPARVLPGGVIIAAAGARPPHQESLEILERDFGGKVIWQFGHNLQVQAPDGTSIWALRQHHDWQRADFPAGYYSPGATPAAIGARTLILTHVSKLMPDIAAVTLEDDRLIEVTPDGNIDWEWTAGEHIGEFRFSAAARAAIKASPGPNAARNGFDWLHTNAATYIGPNHWFDAGDQRFAPDNVLISSRQASLLAIVARNGSIVWQLGPDFSQTKQLQAIGQIIGQHNAHIIPKGLPGAGNVLVFDNGGASGYGFTTPLAPKGADGLARPNSRVLEINPVTLELVWKYEALGKFYASNISGAQRLVNGNTLITEGPDGRVFEVTPDGKIVWEYINPLFSGPQSSNAVYRAYRVPYGWIPQLPHPYEKAVAAPKPDEIKVP